MNLKGRVAIVTGAASGIGRGIALALGRAGASVVCADIDPLGLTEVAAELHALGLRSLAVRTDVSKASEVTAMVEQVLRDFGTVDVLVNDAAYLGFSREHKPFLETDEAEWDLHINVTLKGTLHCCKAVVPSMVAQKRGRIINITSDAAKAMAPRGEALYSAVKSAVAAFSRTLAGELARHHVLVNCVAPGFIITPTVLKTRRPEWREKVEAMIPLRSAGDPEDIAGMVVFLASDEAKHITGQHYSVNGGTLML
ncbi:MAG: fabG [Deltaproteobacteria bacterium]|jgi:NAD(P)-dependent dehydrogenase (short-subunit alcohol dehydrogenase family)|nr:fabG [Deltaproteobacteria bacterium]